MPIFITPYDRHSYAHGALGALPSINPALKPRATVYCHPGAEAPGYDFLLTAYRLLLTVFCLMLTNATWAQTVIQLNDIPPQQSPEGRLFEWRLQYTGPADAPHTFLTPNQIPGAVLDARTGQFEWTPDHTQVGTHRILFLARNATMVIDSTTMQFTVTEVDHGPVLFPLADQIVQEGARLQFFVEATDLNGLTGLTYTSPDRPKGSEFDPTRGLFSWVPDHDDVGAHLISFVVTDPTSRQAATAITITVGEVPHAPSVQSISDQTANDGERLLFVVHATDPNERDVLTFTSSNLPDGAMLDARSGIFSWTPINVQVGIYIVDIQVIDGAGLTDEERVIIRVNDIQHPPTIRPIGDKTARIGEPLEFHIDAIDADGDRLFYTMYNPPISARLDQTGVFIWMPRLGEIAENKPVEITFKVTDSTNQTAIETVRIAIGNVPHAPELSPVADQEVREGEALRLMFFATDQDGGPFRFHSPTLPAGAVIDPTSGVFTWQPDFLLVQQDDARTVPLRVVVTDPSGLTDETTVGIKVIDTTNPDILRHQYRRAFMASSKLLSEIDYQYNLLRKKTKKRKSWRTRLAIGSIVLGGAAPIIQSTDGDSQKWGLTIAGSLTAIIGGITTLLSSEDDLSDDLETLYTEREVVLRKGISLIGQYSENPPNEAFTGVAGEGLQRGLLEFNTVREEAERNLRNAKIVLQPNAPIEMDYFPGIK